MFMNGAIGFVFALGDQLASQACSVMTAARFLGKLQDWQGDSRALCFLVAATCVKGESSSGGGFHGHVPDAEGRALAPHRRDA